MELTYSTRLSPKGVNMLSSPVIGKRSLDGQSYDIPTINCYAVRTTVSSDITEWKPNSKYLQDPCFEKYIQLKNINVGDDVMRSSMKAEGIPDIDILEFLNNNNSSKHPDKSLMSSSLKASNSKSSTRQMNMLFLQPNVSNILASSISATFGDDDKQNSFRTKYYKYIQLYEEKTSPTSILQVMEKDGLKEDERELFFNTVFLNANIQSLKKHESVQTNRILDTNNNSNSPLEASNINKNEEDGSNYQYQDRRLRNLNKRRNYRIKQRVKSSLSELLVTNKPISQKSGKQQNESDDNVKGTGSEWLREEDQYIISAVNNAMENISFDAINQRWKEKIARKKEETLNNGYSSGLKSFVPFSTQLDEILTREMENEKCCSDNDNNSGINDNSIKNADDSDIYISTRPTIVEALVSSADRDNDIVNTLKGSSLSKQCEPNIENNVPLYIFKNPSQQNCNDNNISNCDGTSSNPEQTQMIMLSHTTTTSAIPQLYSSNYDSTTYNKTVMTTLTQTKGQKSTVTTTEVTSLSFIPKAKPKGLLIKNNMNAKTNNLKETSLTSSSSSSSNDNIETNGLQHEQCKYNHFSLLGTYCFAAIMISLFYFLFMRIMSLFCYLSDFIIYERVLIHFR